MVRIGVALAAVVVIVAAVFYALLLGGAVQAVSAVDPDVTIECTAAVRLSEDACREYGDAILDEGAPSHTFEMDDLARLRLDRDLGGFGGTCTARYYLERYADDPAWTGKITCPT